MIWFSLGNCIGDLVYGFLVCFVCQTVMSETKLLVHKDQKVCTVHTIRLLWESHLLQIQPFSLNIMFTFYLYTQPDCQNHTFYSQSNYYNSTNYIQINCQNPIIYWQSNCQNPIIYWQSNCQNPIIYWQSNCQNPIIYCQSNYQNLIIYWPSNCQNYQNV